MTLDNLTSEEVRVLAHVKSGSAFQILQLLAAEDETVKRLIKGKTFGLGLYVAGGMKRCIIVKNEIITPVDNSTANTGVVFRFPDYRNLNLLLSGSKSRMFPILKSFSALSTINIFRELTSRISPYMNPDEDFLKKNFLAVTKLLMCAALRGIKEVAENDSYTEARVAAIPDGKIMIAVEGDAELEACIVKTGNRFRVDPFNDGTLPNAVLTFRDAETAYKLFTGSLNAVEALGSTEIKIRGKNTDDTGTFPHHGQTFILHGSRIGGNYD